VIVAGPPLRILFWLVWGTPSLDHPFPVFMDALAMGSAMSILESHLGRLHGVSTAAGFFLFPQ
jgi:hypothetical protein